MGSMSPMRLEVGHGSPYSFILYNPRVNLVLFFSLIVPFEEDARDPSIWFLDHNFLENMYAMFRKVNAREKILGWYHTGPKLRSADLDINELFRKYTKNPILVVVDPKPEHVGIPTEAYHVVEETKADGGTKKTFVHIPSAIGATEAEEIGVEHLLRDIKDMTVSSLGEQLAQKMTSLKGLHQRLNDIHSYLEKVAAGTLPVNNEIIFQLQDIFNLLPHLDVTELVKAFAVKTNDTMLVIYLSSIIRSVIALHNLVNNKIALKEAEKHEGSSKKEEKEEDAKASSADKDKGKEEGTSKK
eukprot:TRINITY_DN10766_c0_g1_i3.p1 TRINITY_DN10766_c0_g1~~TRINITY_DN10766_c0_g1_i3.p1  ORF type:complete len:299 (+),score=66.78 TRINITY_DN10766_c0_g1_i3:516-1412(+)